MHFHMQYIYKIESNQSHIQKMLNDHPDPEDPGKTVVFLVGESGSANLDFSGETSDLFERDL